MYIQYTELLSFQAASSSHTFNAGYVRVTSTVGNEASERVSVRVPSVLPFCGLVVSVPGYRSRGPGSIPGATRFPEK
jgi:hypothetical protein